MSQNIIYLQQKGAVQQLQQDVSGVQQLFSKWKQCLLRLPSVNQAQKSQLTHQIILKLSNILQTVGQFCFKFQKQMLKLQERVDLLVSKNTPILDFSVKPQYSQYNVVMKKIEVLQKQLKYTKQRGNKLQQALNALMNKEQNNQKSKPFIQQIKLNKDLDFAYGEQSYTYNIPYQSSTKFNKLKCAQQTCSKSKRQNTNDQDSNIYLSSAQKSNLMISSTRSNPFIIPRENPSQYLRTLSIQQRQKVSLKHVPALSRDLNCNPSTDRYGPPAQNRSQTADKHQHRLSFMMKNLGQ